MADTVALVTGGAGNLGRAVTRALLAEGARVAIPSHHSDAPAVLEALKQEFGDRVHSFALDLTTERGAEEAVKEAVRWGGRLDVLAHLVGGYAGGSKVGDTPADVWDHMLTLNLRSAWLMARYSIPAMLQAGGGSIVFVSARAALQGRAGHAAYAVAKSGVLTLAAAIAEEYGDQGIRANAVLPGTMDTAANRNDMPGADASRWTSPEEIAEVIAFLATPRSAPINGAAVPVYGRS